MNHPTSMFVSEAHQPTVRYYDYEDDKILIYWLVGSPSGWRPSLKDTPYDFQQEGRWESFAKPAVSVWGHVSHGPKSSLHSQVAL